MAITATTPIASIEIRYNAITKWPTIITVVSDESTAQTEYVRWDSGRIEGGAGLLGILRDLWNGDGIKNADDEDVTITLLRVTYLPSGDQMTIEDLPVGFYHPLDNRFVPPDLPRGERAIRSISGVRTPTINITSQQIPDNALMTRIGITGVPKTDVIAVSLQLRIQNRFNLDFMIPKEVIEEIGYTNAEGWLSEWNASSSAIVPCFYMEWLHATGAVNRGYPMSNPSWFHVNAARSADISTFMLFFRHHATNDEDFQGIGFIAFSDSSIVIRRADLIYSNPGYQE